MKARLIEIKTAEDLEVENPPRPEIQRIVREGDKILLTADYSGFDSMAMEDYKRKIYKLVLLRDINKNTQIYYIDYDNFKEVMPFIDHIIKVETELFYRKEIDYKKEIASLTDKLMSLNGLWFVRLYKKLKKINLS